jgi:hypothetical protein
VDPFFRDLSSHTHATSLLQIRELVTIKKKEKPETYYLAAPGYSVLSFSTLDRLLLHFSIGIFVIFMHAHWSISLHGS